MFIKLKKYSEIIKIAYDNNDFYKPIPPIDGNDYIYVNIDNIIYIDNNYVFCIDFTLYCSDVGVKKIIDAVNIK